MSVTVRVFIEKGEALDYDFPAPPRVGDILLLDPTPDGLVHRVQYAGFNAMSQNGEADAWAYVVVEEGGDIAPSGIYERMRHGY